MSTLSKNGLVVFVSISQWSGRKFDREASESVEADNQTAAGRARVNKLLVEKQRLQPITTAANKIRKYVYEHSVPWTDAGERLIRADQYQSFIKGIAEQKREFDDAVKTLLDDYDAAKVQAQFDLNGLYDPDDYPSKESLLEKFAVKVSVYPVPTNDFRAEMSEQDAAVIRAHIEQSMARAEREALMTVYAQLKESVVSIRDRMQVSDARFRRALIDNFHSLVQRLDALNIVDDPELSKLGVELKRLTQFDADDLRQLPAARSEFVVEADRIMADFSSVFM